MLLTVLSVPDCPLLPTLLERVREALGDPVVAVEVVVVADEDQARAWGMTGAPTLLVDGVDPFPPGEAQPSLSCRLIRDADGALASAPSVAQLRHAFAEAGPTRVEWADRTWIDSVGRAGRGRRAPLEGGLYAVQRAVLQSMVQPGHPPGAAEIEAVAQEFGRRGTEVLQQLATEDYLTLDDRGDLRAIYPFSVPDSRHRVQIGVGVHRWAMCAIDALGMAAMLDRPVVVETADPISGDPITVRVATADVLCDPAEAVVYLGRRRQEGTAEQVCCDAINVFASPHSAARWGALQTDVDGEILTVDDAARVGREIFGGLLIDG